MNAHRGVRPDKASVLEVLPRVVLSFECSRQSSRLAGHRGYRKIDVFGRHMPSKEKSLRSDVPKQAYSEARRPVWAEVSLSALAHNLETIIGLSPAHHRARTLWQPPGRSREHFARLEG